jgi:hypothetical protein
MDQEEALEAFGSLVGLSIEPYTVRLRHWPPKKGKGGKLIEYETKTRFRLSVSVIVDSHHPVSGDAWETFLKGMDHVYERAHTVVGELRFDLTVDGVTEGTTRYLYARERLRSLTPIYWTETPGVLDVQGALDDAAGKKANIAVVLVNADVAEGVQRPRKLNVLWAMAGEHRAPAWGKKVRLA